MVKSNIKSLNKQLNKNKILKYILRCAPVSRATISEDNNIAPAVVTTTVSTLIKQGVVRDLGEVEYTGENSLGRKRSLVDIVDPYGYAIGCEFTQKTFVFTVINLRGTPIETISFIPTKDDIKNVNSRIISNIKDLISKSGIDKNKIIGIGIAVPGHINPDNSKLITNSPIWTDFCAEKIQNELGINVICENNVRSMAYHEYFVNTRGCPDSFSLFHMGLGMFCANIVDGQLFMGNSFICGEIGHTTVNVNGLPCECGKRGCLQTYCSEKWILDKCRAVSSTYDNSILKSLVNSINDIKISDIIAAYILGDASVSLILDDTIRYLAMSISNLLIISSPKKMFLNSEIFQNELLRNKLIDSIQREISFVVPSDGSEFEVLDFSMDRASIGIALLSITAFFISKP